MLQQLAAVTGQAAEVGRRGQPLACVVLEPARSAAVDEVRNRHDQRGVGPDALRRGCPERRASRMRGRCPFVCPSRRLFRAASPGFGCPASAIAREGRRRSPPRTRRPASSSWRTGGSRVVSPTNCRIIASRRMGLKPFSRPATATLPASRSRPIPTVRAGFRRSRRRRIATAAPATRIPPKLARCASPQS